MPRLLYFFVALCIFAQSAPFALAQESITAQPPQAQTGELLECSDYFSPNKVKANFAAKPTQTAPNEIVTFTGTIQNEHSYPVADASLHVKIFKRNETTRIQGYGDIVVEQKTIETGFVIPAVGSRAVTFEWKAPANIEGGEYYAVFYVTAAGTDFPVMGVNTGDDNLFNQIDFKVIHDGFTPTVYFDRATLEVNNEPYLIETRPVVSSEEATVISTKIVNPTGETKRIPVQWSETTFRTALEQPLQSSKTELLTLEPGEVRDISFTVPPKKDGVTYVTGVLDYGGAKQYLNVTFLRSGEEVFAPQLTIASPLTFPFFAGKETLVFSCIKSLIQEPSNDAYTVSLTLRDADDQIIHQYKSGGPLSTSVQGFGNSFVPAKDYKYAKLTATVQYEGRLILASVIEYDCSKEGFGDCTEKEVIVTPPTENSPSTTGLMWPLILIGTLILAVVTVILIIKRKKPDQIPPTPTTLVSIVFLLVLGVMSAFPSSAEAQLCDPCFDDGVLDSSGTSCGVNGDSVPIFNTCTYGCGDRCGELDMGDLYTCEIPRAPVNQCPLPPPPPPPPPPPGMLSASLTTINVGQQVTFSWECPSALIGFPMAWFELNYLDTGRRHERTDGGPDSYTHTFNTPGTYTVTGDCISGNPSLTPPAGVTETQDAGEVTITVNAPPPPVPAGGSCAYAPASWDCYTVRTIDGPYAGSEEKLCVPVGTTVPSASGCYVTPYTTNPDQFQFNTTSVPADYFSCATNCPAPPPSGSVSGSGCTISAGNSTCSGTVTWSTSNTPSPNVRNTTTNVQYSTAVSGSIGASLQYGSNSVVVRNSSTVLASTDLTASCVGGTSWNGSTCALPPPSGTVSGAGCTISAGNSTCSGTVTWSTSNTPSPNIINTTTNVQYSTAASGNNVAAALVYGSNSISVRNSSTILGTTVLSANCVGGTSWNGSSCALPPPAPSGTVSGATCTISAGNSTCSGTVTWSTSNTPSPNIINITTNNQYSTNPSGTNVAATLAYGANSVSVRNSSTVLDTTTLTTSCAGGTSWDGGTCVAPPPPPPPPVPSGTVSGSDCTISAGNSTCSGTVTWSTSNATSPNVRNTTTNVQYSSSPSGSNVPATLVYGANSVSVRDSSTVLGTAVLTASCVGGTSWNGSSCALPPPPPPATGSISGTNCTISAGNSTCSGTVTWSTSNATSPNVRNTTTNVQYSTNPSGTNVAAALVYGANSVSVRDSSSVLGTVVLSASCVGGTSWNGSSCAAPPPAVPSGTVSGTNCTISAGNSTCSGTVTWSTSNATSPNVINTTTNVQYSTAASGNNVAAALVYGSNSISVRDSSSVLGTVVLSASCAVGSSWNGSACALLPASGSISGTTCTIAVGANACNASLTWTINNGVSPNVTNITNGTVYSNAVSGNNVSAVIAYGSNVIRVRDGATTLGTVVLTTNCTDGSGWNGSSCETLTIPPQNTVSCFTDGIVDSTGTTCGVNGDYVPFLNACSYGCGTGCGQFDDMDTGICFLPVTPPPSSCGPVGSTYQWNGSAWAPLGGTAGWNWDPTTVGMNWNDAPPALGAMQITDMGFGVNREWMNNYGIMYCGTPPLPVVNTLSGVGCTIPAGASTCNGSLTWSIQYASSPNVRNTTTGTSYSTNPSGSGVSIVLGQGVNTIAARNAGVALATTNLTTACAVGSTWDGSVCLANVIPNIDLQINGVDGPLNVAAGTALNLTWTGVGVSNCQLWGAVYSGQPVSVPGNISTVASVPATYTIFCTGDDDITEVTILPLPTVTFTTSVNGGSSSGVDRTINPGDTVTVSWDGSPDVTSCTNNFGVAGNATDNLGVAVTPPAPGSSVTYTISCTGPGGTVSEDIVISTNQLSNLTQPSVTFTPSATVDPVTGNYDSMEVRFQTGNNGGSNTNTTITYLVEVDYGNDGSAPFVADATQSGTIGSLAAGGNYNGSETFTNVPFGNNTIRVTIDSNDDVVEVDEADNSRTLGATISPTAPNFTLTVTPVVVREGQTATITWDTEVTYSLNCSISGPSLATYTFNPSNPLEGPIGNRTTGILSSKSEYLLSCIEPITNTTFTESASVDIVPNAEEI